MSSIKKYIKRVLYVFLYFTGILHICIIVRRKMSSKYPAIILFYHRFTRDHTEDLPPKVNSKTLEKQLKHLKRWYHVISLDELVDLLKTGKDFSRPYAVITIDDGFKDNYDFAYPILKQLDIPASIYLTTGFIGTNRAPWIDEIAYALNISPKKSLSFKELFDNKTFNISSHLEKFEFWNTIYERMIYLENNTKNDLVTKLLHKLNVGEKNRTRSMLDWNEVSEMSKNHISFYAHTHNHPTLSRMDSSEAMFEISESRRIIEEKIGTKVFHFAIPNGKDDDFTEELREFCKSEGFESVVTTNFGVVTIQSDPYSLPRVYPSEPIYVFAAEIARLFIFGR